ncbi:MAG: hypothetical protein AAB667_00675 [Patescibacteria group bacterium]
MTKNVFYGLAIGIALILSTVVVVQSDIQATSAEISAAKARATPTPIPLNSEIDLRLPTPNAKITVGELREMLSKFKDQSVPVMIKLDSHLMRNLGGVSGVCATSTGTRDYFYKHCDSASTSAAALEWGL